MNFPTVPEGLTTVPDGGPIVGARLTPSLFEVTTRPRDASSRTNDSADSVSSERNVR